MPSSDELAYDVVDVFADEAFAGNQLAVVHGTAGLTDAQLLALTREFGFSETAFPSGGDGDRYRVRIYTPGGEIPFAGHPTLGTAWVLRSGGLLTGAGRDAGVRCRRDRGPLRRGPGRAVGRRPRPVRTAARRRGGPAAG